LISYIGGKGRIGKWIAPFIPKDIGVFIEPFGGMMWVFFHMKLNNYPNLKDVVYSDFNALNANLFKCSKEFDTLLNEMYQYPTQQLGVEDTPPQFKEMYDRFQKEVFDDDLILGDEPNFDIAAKYAYVLTQIFSGSKPEKAKFLDYKGVYKCKYITFQGKLKNPRFREHLTKLNHVESLDFEELINKYDSPTSFFYLDPPYWKTENYYSNHDFDSDDHRRLAECLHKIQGRFALSYYEFPQLLEWYPKDKYVWESKDFAKASSAFKGKTQNKGTELLIMNYGHPKGTITNPVIEEVIIDNSIESTLSKEDQDFWFN